MKNINLIRKIAWSFHYSTGLQFEELFSEAFLAYTEALKSYSEEHSKLSTWAVICIKNHLINFSNRELKHREKFPPLLDTMDLEDDTNAFYNFYNHLPKSCQELSDIILNSDIDFVGQNPKKCRAEIRFLLRDLDWSWNMIWDSIREFKMVLK